MRLTPLLMFATVLVNGPLLWAAESEPAPAKVESKPAATATPAKESQAAEPKPADTAAADATKSTSEKAASPQRFIPSEQVRADFDVSFPIDI